MTEIHTTKAGRKYYMHYVRLQKLEEKKEYFYQVKSGGASAQSSDVYSFRAPYSSGETKIALCEWLNLAYFSRDLSICVCDLYAILRLQTATWASTAGTTWRT